VQKLLEVLQGRPVARQTDENSPDAHADLGGDLDRPCPPSARVSFAQKIVLTAAVAASTATMFGQGFRGEFLVRIGRRKVGNQPSRAHLQVVRQAVQVQPEQVGPVAVVAEPVRVQPAREFLVASGTAAFNPPAAVGVLIVGAAGHHPRAGKQPSTADPKSVERRAVEELPPSAFILANRAAVGAFGSGFCLDERPTRPGPRAGPIIERVEQRLLDAGLRESPDRFLQRSFAAFFQHAVHTDADAVLDAECFAAFAQRRCCTFYGGELISDFGMASTLLLLFRVSQSAIRIRGDPQTSRGASCLRRRRDTTWPRVANGVSAPWVLRMKRSPTLKGWHNRRSTEKT